MDVIHDDRPFYEQSPIFGVHDALNRHYDVTEN
jgi:hypothetical protein